MSIRRINPITCSLNLGQIYNLSYTYSPENGVNITIFFVNELGQYNPPQLLPMQKAAITIGGAAFSMYVKSWSNSKSSGRRVMKVVFMDEAFQLERYQIVLTGRGCGLGTYPLGRPVDKRTLTEKLGKALDPVAERIKDFTQFPDIEYTFNDFLAVLRQQFNVTVLAAFDTTINNTFTGSFRDVLRAWCGFYNLSFFFENGVIKIFDPTKLTVNLPTQPIDATEYEVEESIEGTYGSTVSNHFQQEGGQKSLNQTSGKNGALLVRENTLFPVGNEFNLPQTTMDLNQVVAAMYGQQFWFLYNYAKGTTAAQCGWSPIEQTSINNTNIAKSAGQLGGGSSGRIAIFNQDIFNQRFAAYQKYGLEIAGRYYLSYEESEIATDQGYQWFDESGGQIFSFVDVANKAIKLDFLTPTEDGTNVIGPTVINSYYPGVNYVGNRIAYYDGYKVDFAAAFAFSGDPVAQAVMANLVEKTFQDLFEVAGSRSMDYSELYPALGNIKALAYVPGIVPQNITNLYAGFEDKQVYFKPRFTSVPIKGISNADYSNLKATQNQPDSVEVVTTQGPTVVSNTSVIKTVKNGSYTVYYDKYSACGSASSAGDYYERRFKQRDISTDNIINFTFSKDANNTYKLTRDYTTINALVNNPLLPQLAQARTFTTKRVNFSVNYFYDIPLNYLTNGLIGLDVQVSDSGITSSYSFSNEILAVPNYTDAYDKLEQRIRNSYIRGYRPNETIS